MEPSKLSLMFFGILIWFRINLILGDFHIPKYYVDSLNRFDEEKILLNKAGEKIRNSRILNFRKVGIEYPGILRR